MKISFIEPLCQISKRILSQNFEFLSFSLPAGKYNLLGCMLKTSLMPLPDYLLLQLVCEITSNPDGQISLEEFRQFFESSWISTEQSTEF